MKDLRYYEMKGLPLNKFFRNKIEETISSGWPNLNNDTRREKKMTVISAFPGMGKTYFYENCQDIYTSYDSDSSQFDKTNFPQNYIEYIKQKLQDNDRDIIFVSSHKAVRDALKEAGIRYVLIYPSLDIKDDIIERYRRRGSSESFIKLLKDNYSNWVTEIDDEVEEMVEDRFEDKLSDRLSVEILSSNIHVSDIIDDIVEGGWYHNKTCIGYEMTVE